MARHMGRVSRPSAPGKPRSLGHRATLNAIDTYLQATCPYVRSLIIPIHPSIASQSNQGERLDIDKAEASRAVLRGEKVTE